MPTQKNIESIIEGIRRKDSCSKDSSYLVYSNATSMGYQYGRCGFVRIDLLKKTYLQCMMQRMYLLRREYRH